MTEQDDWLDGVIDKGIHAVGIKSDGDLIPITSVDSLHEVVLSGLIVSVKHRTWFKENETVLRASLQDRGQVIIFGGIDSIVEVF